MWHNLPPTALIKTKFYSEINKTKGNQPVALGILDINTDRDMVDYIRPKSWHKNLKVADSCPKYNDGLCFILINFPTYKESIVVMQYFMLFWIPINCRWEHQ